MKGMGSRLNRGRYNKFIYLIAILFVIIALGVSVLVYIITGSLEGGVITLFGVLVLCLLAYLIHRLDDVFISGIITDLSEMVDVLIQLEEKDIFPDNEDTVLSKLQSKVIKLVQIMKSRNRIEEQEHENIKMLVSDISHQLKTPIANLKMYSQFLSDESVSGKQQREYIEVIRISTERLNFLSENMIKISRLESGIIRLDMKRQNLNETVLKAVRDVYLKARQKNIEIKYNEECRIDISHDRNWTAESVFNLLENAVKYGKEGNVIKLSVEHMGMFVQIVVEDENGAIPCEEHNNIFMRFYRGKNSRNKEGLGIGLYLSREITVKQGGYMNFRTTDKGNVFYIVLYIDI